MGAEFELPQIQVADFSRSEFVKVGPFPHPTQKSIMPVVAYRDGEIRPLGTGFAISNHGLVMTARHVIDEALKITGWESNKPASSAEGWWVGALYAAEPAAGEDVPDLLGGLIAANMVHLNAFLDIGVMHLNLPRRTADGNLPPMPALRISPGVLRKNSIRSRNLLR
jgi:hypothetical protein